jgi:uncharacterized membrane protein HdeD (DUF308 family)
MRRGTNPECGIARSYDRAHDSTSGTAPRPIRSAGNNGKGAAMTDTMRSDPPATGAGWGWIIAYGVLSTLFGLAALLWPFPATLAATLVIGVAFVSSGVFALIAGFRGTGAESRGYSILLGVLSIIAGAVMVARPLTGAISLTIVVAAWLLVRGVAEIALVSACGGDAG